MEIFIPNLPRYGGRCVNCALWRIGINVPWTHVEKMKRKFGENRRVPAEVLSAGGGTNGITVITVGGKFIKIATSLDGIVVPCLKRLTTEKFVDNCRPKIGERDEGRGARDDQGAEANVG